METQNNPACTESVRAVKMLKLDRIQKKKRKSVRSIQSYSRDIHETLTRMNDLVTGEVRCMSKRFVTLITAERLFTCKEKTGFWKWWTVVKTAKHLLKQHETTWIQSCHSHQWCKCQANRLSLMLIPYQVSLIQLKKQKRCLERNNLDTIMSQPSVM